jgi:hypothetical protein
MKIKAELSNREIAEQLEIALQNIGSYTPEHNTKRVLEMLVPEQLKRLDLCWKFMQSLDDLMKAKEAP